MDGVLYDLTRPLEKSCNLQLLDFETDDGKKVRCPLYDALLTQERSFGILLRTCLARPVRVIMDAIFALGLQLRMDSTMKWQWKGLFAWEILIEFSIRNVSSVDFPSLESLAKKAVSEKQPFVRLEVTKEDLLEMFKARLHSPFLISVVCLA